MILCVQINASGNYSLVEEKKNIWLLKILNFFRETKKVFHIDKLISNARFK